MENVIIAENLVKEYNGLRAVAGIDFAVRARECFGLLGPNGAGKTSTVRMIYAFSPVTAGKLTVLGMDVRTRPREIKRRLGVVPQENNLDPDLKVLDNLLVYAGFFGLPRALAAAKARELLAFFGLEGKAGVKVDKLSGGMKRRLIIARALINDPAIVILDEPTTGLDPQARHLVWQKLRRLKERGVTLVLTTHYLDEAAQLCDRLVIMDRGRILEEGAPAEMVSRHIGAEVLELGLGGRDPAPVAAALESLVRGYQVVGENLVLYPHEGKVLLNAVQALPWRFGHQLLRPATLEDVFLKLTGRGLSDDF
ncbi:MAG: ATP-binding cassette domain-containing protein [Thermoanaerobacterales bacterium]|nr:ATP-binding cassette domain-containing protein [Thermoanaerobacterales bacterium]